MTEKDGFCPRDHCGRCCTGIGQSCAGCAGPIPLTPEERDFLLMFAATPFLPVGEEQGSGRPVYLADDGSSVEKTSEIITALAQKQLLQIDYDMPLLNYDYGAYQDLAAHGSMALTALGQQVIDDLEMWG